ncbi:hypothetical protein FRC07_009069 [Ceratobasidium sp. 392]|nr:hypothetical protein FRC07_009069 [Ceratobasidium sp. 392]
MSQVIFAPAPSDEPTIDLDNVQGDVIYGLTKSYEHFSFFTIVKADEFKQKLPQVLADITTSRQVLDARKTIIDIKATSPDEEHHVKFLNIAFSQKGLNALGLTGDSNNLKDRHFAEGQQQDASSLGDPTTDSHVPKLWKNEFLGAHGEIHGVLLGAGNTYENAATAVNDALEKLKPSANQVYRREGKTRPGELRKHEHFGWRDGISNPFIKGAPMPSNHPTGSGKVDPGVIVVGHKGDEIQRPKWAFEGSFMVFRELKQMVPEFHQFLKDNPVPEIPDRDKGSELQGARFFGRFKNGIPIQKTLDSSDTSWLNHTKINDFRYPDGTGDAGQDPCPYSAHIRKTYPRNDIPENAQEETRINRKGIAYGPEVGEEQPGDPEKNERGLAFVCYQSVIGSGFRRHQTDWANNTKFLAQEKKMQTIGFDPIIGQAGGKERTTQYTQSGSSIRLPQDFVIARGGEYLFTPSIKALRSVFVGKPFPE